MLVFGINTGVSNVIRLHLDGDMPVDADLDLSDVFKDFTADGISVDITVRVSPVPTYRIRFHRGLAECGMGPGNNYLLILFFYHQFKILQNEENVFVRSVSCRIGMQLFRE